MPELTLITPKYYDNQYPHTGDCNQLVYHIESLEKEAKDIIREHGISPYKLQIVRPALDHISLMISTKKDMLRVLKCGTDNVVIQDNKSVYETYPETSFSEPAKTPEKNISNTTMFLLVSGFIVIAGIVLISKK